MKEGEKEKMLPFVRKEKDGKAKPSSGGNAEVIKLIPKDEISKFELPKVNGRKISTFAEFIEYFIMKKEEMGGMLEFFNIDPDFLTLDDFRLFLKIYRKNVDMDELRKDLNKLRSAANKAMEAGIRGQENEDVSNANTRYFFHQLLEKLFEERSKIQ